MAVARTYICASGGLACRNNTEMEEGFRAAAETCAASLAPGDEVVSVHALVKFGTRPEGGVSNAPAGAQAPVFGR